MQNDRSCRLLQKMTVGWYRDTTNHDTEIGLFDKDQFCSISVDRRRAYMRSYNSLTTPRDARGWEWIDNAAKMVSGKRDQRIVRLLARRTTLRGFCFQEFFFFFILPQTNYFSVSICRKNEKIYHFSTIIYEDLLRIIPRILEFFSNIRKFLIEIVSKNDPMHCRLLLGIKEDWKVEKFFSLELKK